ncbi:mechanosensitive ion channel family protein [Paracoccus sp. Z330]|uniref:Small-conductance mechanosensitive channel n=1 Tax=Paracoccus onchidii TaxID=3017813 RepID=A0ABT4ZI93_9RHOB|nr:mechanosensitive ion channel family protein [Paracoccus onchidii]MDB6178718.1 mechanosensitive ion channel family protein [Paracoccus onchidii]
MSRILQLVLVLSLLAVTAPMQLAYAQDAAAQDAAPTAEAASDYPAGLVTPDIDLEELEIRLIPLTAGELSALAGAWQEIAREQTEAVADKQIEVRNASGAAADTARNEVVELTRERQDIFARYTAVVNMLEKKGGDEAEIASLRAYRSAIVVEEKQRADWRTLMQQAQNWVFSKDGGLRIAERVGVIVAALFGLLIVARMVRGYAQRFFRRLPNLSKLLQAFMAMTVYWLTIAIGLMIVLSALGIDIAPLFALVGGASFIAAFAMQDTLGNLAAGLMIMINRPFDEGDYVSVAGTGGTVSTVSIVSTTVLTPDNQVIVIPNSRVWGDVITNVTASATRRVDLVFGIGYDDSIETAQQTLEEVVKGHAMVLTDPAPVIRVNELADSSVNFIVRPWTKAADYWTVYWDLTRAVKEAFDRKGISIPFPQTDMHIRVASEAAVPALTAGSAGRGRPRGAPDYMTGDSGAENAPEDGGEER